MFRVVKLKKKSNENGYPHQNSEGIEAGHVINVEGVVTIVKFLDRTYASTDDKCTKAPTKCSPKSLFAIVFCVVTFEDTQTKKSIRVKLSKEPAHQ